MDLRLGGWVYAESHLRAWRLDSCFPKMKCCHREFPGSQCRCEGKKLLKPRNLVFNEKTTPPAAFQHYQILTFVASHVWTRLNSKFNSIRLCFPNFATPSQNAKPPVLRTTNCRATMLQLINCPPTAEHVAGMFLGNVVVSGEPMQHRCVNDSGDKLQDMW